MPNTDTENGRSPHGPDHPDPPGQSVHITVVGHRVVLMGRRHTGRAIKDAAIEQGADIGADFVLSRVIPNGRQEVIADDATITVRADDDFWAVPGDDNS